MRSTRYCPDVRCSNLCEDEGGPRFQKPCNQLPRTRRTDAGLLEELKDVLRVGIGDRERLDAELLLCLQSLQPG